MIEAPVKTASTEPNSAQSSWSASLNCRLQNAGARTVVRRDHVGPLSVQRPFYPEGDVAHVYLLHPPGGVVGGDNLSVDIVCDDGAAGLITTPGANKFYRSNGETAKVSQKLANTGGSLEWFPQENIFFPGCQVNIQSDVKISEGSSLVWWEINCFGRGSDEKSFSHGSVTSVLNLHVDSALLLRERIKVESPLSVHMASGMRGNTVSGTLILHPVRSESVEYVRSLLEPHKEFSATTFDSLLVVRYLGNSAEKAKTEFCKVWSKLRKSLNGKNACPPRIWLT